jgi:hypothetical protein
MRLAISVHQSIVAIPLTGLVEDIVLIGPTWGAWVTSDSGSRRDQIATPPRAMEPIRASTSSTWLLAETREMCGLPQDSEPWQITVL